MTNTPRTSAQHRRDARNARAYAQQRTLAFGGERSVAELVALPAGERELTDAERARSACLLGGFLTHAYVAVCNDRDNPVRRVLDEASDAVGRRDYHACAQILAVADVGDLFAGVAPYVADAVAEHLALLTGEDC